MRERITTSRDHQRLITCNLIIASRERNRTKKKSWGWYLQKLQVDDKSQLLDSGIITHIHVTNQGLKMARNQKHNPTEQHC
ncbi:hypothetical protein VTN49DRAFT_7248 [Thermomyces lanuginosus]|uniref:uncharacterized protein n=1 Tax=Thermomyces lanuginosus TaxID=5541 RepID=UPI0037438246